MGSDQAQRWRIALYIVLSFLVMEVCWLSFAMGRVFEILNRCEP